MRFLVVGAGSTGGYFGGRLAQAGRDVTFLVRPQRAAQLQASGLQIQSPHGDVTLVPQLVQAGQIAAPYDVIVLAVKGYALEASLEDFAPAVGPRTVILPILNGMRHIDRLRDRFGARAVAGGLCKCSTTLDAAGRIIHLNRAQQMSYGELDGQPSTRMAQIDAALQDAGFEARLSTDIAREMWAKWFFLSALAAITCLMRGSVGQVAATAHGADTARQIVDEVLAIITAVGMAPSPKAVAAAKEQLTEAGSPLAASMFRDLQAGLPVEADEILGDLVARGAAAGVAAPLLTAAHVNLSVYAAGRSS